MLKCDHFIYTAARIGRVEGYQVIAKSVGITDKIIAELSEYLYPLGVKIRDFNESRSQLLLSNDKISYSIVKNIGVGYDGRRGTLYNHTFVIDRKDFEKLDFDSRIFEKYFIRNDFVRGELKPIQIEPTLIPPNFELLRKLGPTLLEELLHSLFRRKKIALIKTDELKILQNLIAVLPPLLRLIPFSTLVVEPDRQYQFEFIQIPGQVQSKMEKDFIIINPSNPSLTKRKSIYDDSVKQLVQIILNKDEKLLQQIFKNYEKISVRLLRVRRISTEEIFNQGDFEYLAKRNNFKRLRSKVKKLYASRKFNEASPAVITSITKRIRKIIKNGLENYKLSKKKRLRNIEQIVPVVEILLNCMHYLYSYTEKPISRTLKDEIYNEILKLEEILEEYSTPETAKRPYAFDYFEYMKWQGEQIVRTVQAGIAFALWMAGFNPKRN